MTIGALTAKPQTLTTLNMPDADPNGLPTWVTTAGIAVMRDAPSYEERRAVGQRAEHGA